MLIQIVIRKGLTTTELFNKSKIVSINVESKEDQVSIAPNPAITSSTLHLNMSSDSDVNISIYGPDGKLVRTFIETARGSESVVSDVIIDDLPVGVYNVRLTQDDVTIVKRLIMIK